MFLYKNTAPYNGVLSYQNGLELLTIQRTTEEKSFYSQSVALLRVQRIADGDRRWTHAGLDWHKSALGQHLLWSLGSHRPGADMRKLKRSLHTHPPADASSVSIQSNATCIEVLLLLFMEVCFCLDAVYRHGMVHPHIKSITIIMIIIIQQDFCCCLLFFYPPPVVKTGLKTCCYCYTGTLVSL